MAKRRQITVALAGNPNSGKTTIFNNLTGARQHVGNYPGVTVERKEGTCRRKGLEIKVIDLPGTYSLTAYSIEERVARRFLIDEKPDVVVDIIDASNLERNLYLATQLIELQVPLVLALNMSDVAQARGIKFDLQQLSELLGAPIVQTVGHKNRGMEDLLKAVEAVARGERLRSVTVGYGREIDAEIARIESLLVEQESLGGRYPPRWLAVKLLENDQDVCQVIRESMADPSEVLAAAEAARHRIERDFGDSPEIVIADRRYGFISGACQEAVRSSVESRHTLSDRIDSVVTNRVLGFPLFVLLMYLVFHLTFTLGDPMIGWVESLFSMLGGWIGGLWPEGAESPLKSLIVEGIIGGVGGVLVFLPIIMLLFLAIAFLEDSGYMARAAFIMDRLMHKIGLHGKSFIPMLIGFGCSVPAIMATRTLESRRDRLVTMLVIPLMSCGARLPIYALIIPAFFANKILLHLGPLSIRQHAFMLLIIYLVGVVLAIVSAKILRSTIFKGESAPFVMELPPYRMPTIKGVVIHMWERAVMYLKKAATILLGASILLWAMTTYPTRQQFDRDYQGELAESRASYVAAVKELNAGLGLPADSDLLVRAVEGDAGAGQAAVAARFLACVEKVETVRADFDAAVDKEQAKQGSSAWIALESRHKASLDELQQSYPKTYTAVVRYLDDAKAPYDRTVLDIEQSRQAEQLVGSFSGRIGSFLAPALKPMGFDWKIGTALIGAVAAKEVFVAQLGIVYAVGEADEQSETLRARLRESYTPLTGFCIMLFCLISMPCAATVVTTFRESHSAGWALFQAAGLTVMAYVLTVVTYQVGSLLGIGTTLIGG